MKNDRATHRERERESDKVTSLWNASADPSLIPIMFHDVAFEGKISLIFVDLGYDIFFIYDG